MTDIEPVESLRTDPAPAQAVVDRHRAQLMAECGAPAVMPLADRSEPTARPVEITRRPPAARRWPRFAAAAAVVVAVGLIALVAAQRDGDRTLVADEGPRVSAPAPLSSDPAPTTVAAPPPPVCGAILPINMTVPGGYDGPRLGASVDAVSAPTADQYVIHWASASGSIELRWPADAGRWAMDDNSTPPPEEGVAIFEVAPAVSPAGRTFEVDTFALPDQADPACAVLQVAVFDDSPETVERVVLHIIQHVFADDTALVVGTLAAETAPTAGTCRAPVGIDPPPNRGGSVTGFGTFPAPTDALLAFVETQGETGSAVGEPTLVLRGYTELTLPDGSIAYVYFPDLDGGGFVATVIRAVPVDGGWTVTTWEATGC